jgi:hypothetical protein
MRMVSSTMPEVRATAGSHREADRIVNLHFLFLDVLMISRRLSYS